jgi:hypothetical protein
VTRNNDFNTAWDGFKTIITNIINKHAPLVERTVRGKDCPWLTREIKQKMYERDYQLRKAKRTKNPEDCSHCRRLGNLTTYAIRKGNANYERSIFNENELNPKNFWKQIKKSYPVKNKSTSSTSFKVENEVITDKSKISNAFCDFFRNIPSLMKTTTCNFMNSALQYNDMDGLSRKINPSNHEFYFTEVRYLQEVLRILESLNPYKPAGVDNIPPKVVKDAATEIAKPLVILASRSLQCGQFLSAEKIARITPVYKSDEKTLLDNYRPISTLPVFSKVLEKLVYYRISRYLEEHDLFNNYQYGFRQNRSTKHAITILIDDVRTGIDQGQLTGSVFMDLRKAFETVNHGRLLDKLPAYGIKDIEMKWFISYLFARAQIVNFKGTLSDKKKHYSRSPAGLYPRTTTVCFTYKRSSY